VIRGVIRICRAGICQKSVNHRNFYDALKHRFLMARLRFKQSFPCDTGISYRKSYFYDTLYSQSELSAQKRLCGL
jgi:hypothetical protein